MHKKIAILLLPVLLAATTQPASTQSAPKTDTPENALRSFLRAMALHDPTLGNAVSLPTDGSVILYKDAATPLQTTLLLHWADTVLIKRFAVGDKFTLPGPRHVTITFDENYINDNKQQLLPEGALIPFNIEHQPDGRWLVDPYPTIAARRAAERARQRRAASQPATAPH